LDQKELKKQIEQILESSFVGTLATVKENKPYTRYMTFFNDNFTLYTITSKETYKVNDLEENPNVHILLGYDGEGIGDDYVEYEGKASLKDDRSLIEKLWNDKMKAWFKGPDDENIIVLEIKPEYIRMLNKKGQPPRDLEF